MTDASRSVDADAVTGWLAEVAPRFEGLSVEEHRPVPTTGGAGVVTPDPNPPKGSGRPGQVVAGKGYRKPESTRSSGCRDGGRSSSCGGGTGRKAVRRGGKWRAGHNM